MSRRLLDTDILSEIIKGRNAHVATKAAVYLVAQRRFTTSSITVAEIVFGLRRMGREARDPLLAKALPALRRARKRAEEIARATNTAVVYVVDGETSATTPAAIPPPKTPRTPAIPRPERAVPPPSGCPNPAPIHSTERHRAEPPGIDIRRQLRGNLGKLAFRQSFLRGVIFGSIPGAPQ